MLKERINSLEDQLVLAKQYIQKLSFSNSTPSIPPTSKDEKNNNIYNLT